MAIFSFLRKAKDKQKQSNSIIDKLRALRKCELPTSARQYDDTYKYAAATAVLNTNELLQNIICHTALHERYVLRRVSKTWNQVVTHVGYHLDPYEPHQPQLLTRWLCLPLYGYTWATNPHRHIHWFQKAAAPSHTKFNDSRSTIQEVHYVDEVRLIAQQLVFRNYWLLSRSELERFITTPPVSRVLVSFDCSWSTQWKRISFNLREVRGIRFKHVVEAYKRHHTSWHDPNVDCICCYIELGFVVPGPDWTGDFNPPK